MTESSTLVGRDELIAEVVREINKGKHVVLTGAVGIGKSAALQAALKIIEPRPSEWYQFDPVAYDVGEHPETADVEQRPPKGLCPPTGGRIPSATGPCSAPRTGQHPESLEVEHSPPKGLSPPTGPAPLPSSPQRLAGRTPPPPDARVTPKEDRAG